MDTHFSDLLRRVLLRPPPPPPPLLGHEHPGCAVTEPGLTQGKPDTAQTRAQTGLPKGLAQGPQGFFPTQILSSWVQVPGGVGEREKLPGGVGWLEYWGGSLRGLRTADIYPLLWDNFTILTSRP